jgi:5'-nucleotidase
MNSTRPVVPAVLAAFAAFAVFAVAAVPATAAAAAQPKARKAPAPLRVLVSNDDGVKAAGIDAIVTALRKLPKVTVTVVAPAENQSGTGGKTTPGTLTAARTTTLSGYPAIAVDGYPADSIDYALSHVVRKARVDLVVSGINQGANLGPSADLSGTVGAARAAAQHGLPALATSKGTPTPTGFAGSVASTIAWVTANRTRLKPGTVHNMNIPQCSTGRLRGTVVATSTPTFAPGVNPFVAVDCTQTAAPGADEVTDFLAGFATVTTIPATPAAAAPAA